LKTKVSKKASVLRNSRRQTGNKHIQFNELTEKDIKVLGIVGFDYVEGTACPDSWPEELVSKFIFTHYYFIYLQPLFIIFLE